jgi:hypothetical protein
MCCSVLISAFGIRFKNSVDEGKVSILQSSLTRLRPSLNPLYHCKAETFLFKW